MNHGIRLEQVQIPEPCSVDWSTMTGDDRTRYCDACGKHVHNLSTRSRREGEALIASSDGGLCVQMTLDARGRPVTRDGMRFWPVVRRVWPVMSVAVGFLLGLTGCHSDDVGATDQDISNTRVLGGAIATPSVANYPPHHRVLPPTTEPTTQSGDCCGNDTK